jgi:hypothetical protein
MTKNIRAEFEKQVDTDIEDGWAAMADLLISRGWDSSIKDRLLEFNNCDYCLYVYFAHLAPQKYQQDDGVDNSIREGWDGMGWLSLDS